MITQAVALLAALAVAPDAAIAVPAPSQEAVAFHRGGNALWVLNQVAAIALPLLVLATGLHRRLRDAALRRTRGYRGLAASVLAVWLFALFAIVSWPLAYYQSYWRLHAYGLSNQSFLRWLDHWAMAVLVDLAVAGLVAWMPYQILRIHPRRWWLATGLLTLPFLLFGALVMPVAIDPLFNRQSRLGDPVLEGKILELARRSGIAADRVYEVDKSRDTRAINAYVKGLMDTRRIVLWDTLLDRLEEDEILFVMGHEMGHYVLGHVVQGIVLATGLILVGLGLVHVAATAILRRCGARLGIDGLADLASMPLLLALAQAVALVLTPVGFAFGRHLEHEADRFALELTRDNRAGATAFLAFQRENLGVPRPAPLYRLWRASHPSLADRVAFCNAYRPWAEGKPLRYAGRFETPPGPASP
jgi:Zn-dependent protease with chaperone function